MSKGNPGKNTGPSSTGAYRVNDCPQRMSLRKVLLLGVVYLLSALTTGKMATSSTPSPIQKSNTRPSTDFGPGIKRSEALNDRVIISRHGRGVYAGVVKRYPSRSPSIGHLYVSRKPKYLRALTNINLEWNAGEGRTHEGNFTSGLLSKRKKGKCHVKNESGEIIADCSKMGNKHIPSDLPSNITILNLSRNRLSALPIRAFSRYPLLTTIDLSKNVIHDIVKDSFLGLSNLKLLDMAENRLNFNNCTCLCCNNPFGHLSNLSTLNVSRNLYHLLPFALDECMRGLDNLEHLDITFTNDGKFGPGFRNMTSLKSLDLSLSYKLTYVTGELFSNLQTLKLTNLSIARCNLSFIEPDALRMLPYLEVLDLSNNEYLGLKNASRALYSLQNSSLKVLSINRLSDPTIRDTIIVTPDIFQNIAHTNLTELNMDYNSIAKIEQTALEILPQSLKVWSIRKNKLADQFNFLRPLLRLVNLECLNAEDQSGHTFQTKMNLNLGAIEKLDGALQKDRHVTIPVPPKLEFLRFTRGNSFRFGAKNVTFVNSTLKRVYLNANNLLKFYVWINGLDTVEILDLSYNHLMIKPGFFDGLTGLKYLYLYDNKLNKTVSCTAAGQTFLRNYNLINLNLGKNEISKLFYKVFQNNSLLERLNLDNNKLTRLGSRIGHFKRLKSLDLSKNAFAYLDTSEMNDLEMISRNGPVEVNLKLNPLVCSCESLPFLKWASSLRKNITLVDFRNMSCLAQNGSAQISLRHLENIVQELEVRCASYIGLMISLSLALLTSVLVVGGGLVYRFRWRLRYIYHVQVLRKFLHTSHPHARYGYRSIDGNEPDGVRDIFVAYADEDRGFVTGDLLRELETKENLSMYIRDRDSMPGLEIATNITRAVRCSSVTLLLLSKEFLRNDWCNYEFQMARVESAKRRQNVLLYLMYDDIPGNVIPDNLLAAMKMGKVIEKPSETTDASYIDTFWAMLVQAIRITIQRQNNVPSLAI